MQFTNVFRVLKRIEQTVRMMFAMASKTLQLPIKMLLLSLLNENRQITVDYVACSKSIGILRELPNLIFTENLGLSKLPAWWMP